MPPPLMAFVCVVGIIGLFVLARDNEPRPSNAMWIPTAWLFINCSRPVSFWLQAFGFRTLSRATNSAQLYLEGSPLDAGVFLFLLIAAFIVLMHRIQRVAPLFRRMLPILLFFAYCALSTLWSDYPFVALKHWSKGIGDVVMALVILTDPDPMAALKHLLNRVSFVLLPLSILFIKYYPSLGRSYTHGGLSMYSGVTTGKNALGVICLVFGLGSLWRFLAVYRDKQVAGRTRLLIVYGTILGMTLWLLRMSNSVTSISCFVMAGGLLILAGRPIIVRKPALVHLLVAAIVGMSLFAIFFDSSGELVQNLGRNSTLTGRTAIWKAVLALAGNPLFGTGYESFWLGNRLEEFWSVNGGAFDGIQEAHNGYLEIYLNLGWIGVTLLAGLIILSYPRVVAAFRTDPDTGRLGLAFFASELVYNLTEAGFRMMFPLWIFFLLAVVGIPKAPQPPPPIDADLTDDAIVGGADFERALATFR